MPHEFANKEDFETAVATVVSQVITPRFKSLKSEVIDSVKGTLGEFAKTQNDAWTEKFTTLESVVAAGGKPGKGAKKDKDDKGDDDAIDPNSPALRTMQKKIEELEAANKKSEELRKAETEKNRGMTVRTRLAEVLEAGGVSDLHKKRAAMAILISEDKRVAFSESLEDAAWLDTDGAPVELETGVRTWLKSEEGEHYAAASGAAGAGSRPAKGKTPQQQPRMSEAELGMAFMAAAQGTVLPGT